MNDIILSHKRWQQIFDVQLIIALIITVLELITKKQRNFGNSKYFGCYCSGLPILFYYCL